MKLINTAIGIVNAKIARLPFYVRFHITHRCNYRCRMCNFHHLGDHSKELSGPQVRVVAERLAELGARHIVITGGEPFVRPDLPEVIAVFAEQSFSVRIQTNGGPQVTRPLLAACVSAGLQDLSVSIDTLDSSLQDEICGSRGVVQNALRTLQLATELLPGSMSLANVVASTYNFEELPSLVSYFYDMGIYTYITPVMISGDHDKDINDFRFRSDDNTFLFGNLNPEVRDRVMNQLIELRRNGLGLVNSTRFLKDFHSFLLTGQRNWPCSSETHGLEVHPDGNVSFCKEKPPSGNILDPGFIDYYRSREFYRKAALLAENCTGCFYGEYREPYYAVNDLSVLREWTRDWFRTFRRGLRFGKRGTRALRHND